MTARVVVDSWQSLPREVVERAVEMVQMACAEAGYPATPERESDGNYYADEATTPHEVWLKARVLVFTHLGIPFEVKP